MLLALEDLKGRTESQILDHIEQAYQTNREELKNRFEILIAYESTGSWGCDSSSWFLLREKSTGNLFENHARHCSCYGFEEQWSPEPTTVEYLKSDKFYVCTGGYDSDAEGNTAAIAEYIRNNLLIIEPS